MGFTLYIGTNDRTFSVAIERRNIDLATTSSCHRSAPDITRGVVQSTHGRRSGNENVGIASGIGPLSSKVARTINVQSIWYCGHLGLFSLSRISNLPVFKRFVPEVVLMAAMSKSC
jgi:hypothetical protein